MFFTEFLIALFVAAILTGIFYMIGRVGPWSGFMWFFLLILLVSWAGGVWVESIGPTIGGVAWIPFVIFGLLLAILLAAAIPPRKPRNLTEVKEEIQRENAVEDFAVVAINAFFIILIVSLVASVAVNYLRW